MENEKSDFLRWVEADMLREKARVQFENMTEEQRERMRVFMRNLLSFGPNNEYTFYLD